MNLLLSHKKPTFSLDLPIHCTFRSSKAYLWGLISERLSLIQKDSPVPIHILDAACHALITRQIFPESSLYYGLDISISRLKKGFALKRESDVLYHADLCKSLGLDNSFDVVVSCNTLSHLPGTQQLLALHNLISSCVSGGSLLVNCNIDSSLQSITHLLSTFFTSLEIVYFDSCLSLADEESSLVNESNIRKKIIHNEFEVFNDACLHSQVLFICHNYIPIKSRNVPPANSIMVLRLNRVPNTQTITLATDDHILASDYCTTSSIFLFTSKLYHSEVGKSLRSSLIPLVSCVSLLDDFNPALLKSNSSIFILGLEREWIDNLAADRILVNSIRELPDTPLFILLVESRQNTSCSPSLICSDV